MIDKRLHDVRGTFVTWLALAGLTNEQIARIVGWSEEKVADIRRRYVDEKRVMIDLAKQIADKMGVGPDAGPPAIRTAMMTMDKRNL